MGWRGRGGEMRARRRRREFCAQRISNLGGSEVGVQQVAPTAQDGISPNGSGGPSVLQEAKERTLCKDCRSPGRLLRGRAASAGPWATKSPWIWELGFYQEKPQEGNQRQR